MYLFLSITLSLKSFISNRDNYTSLEMNSDAANEDTGARTVDLDIKPKDSNFNAASSRDTIQPHIHEKRRSRQVEALAMKAICLQKRAWFTTCCCVFLCPILMIAIPCILGAVYTKAFAYSSQNETVSFADSIVYSSSMN